MHFFPGMAIDFTLVNPITEAIIGAAIKVHRALGPGLLESAYHKCRVRALTYLKLTGCPVGLLLNFNVPVMKQGIRRLLNKHATVGVTPDDAEEPPSVEREKRT